MNDRYVVLGLAHVRSPWFREVSRWATSAAIPLDFLKCVSADELRARLRSGQAFSAVLADAGLAGIDRDLVDQAHDQGCAVILVDDGGITRDTAALGVSARLPAVFDRNLLLTVLDEHASRIGAVANDLIAPAPAPAPGTAPWQGRLFAVTGAGGTGTSIAAMALARGLAADARTRGGVLLADLALDADQAMLHDARDIVPGLQELVEAFRHGTPVPDEIVRLTFGDHHPYRLLLGLRRHRDWTALRPRAWQAALDGMRSTFTNVVADVDPDVEGEQHVGSFDIEERNLLARTVTISADVVVVTAMPYVQGIHRLVRILSGLVEHGVPAERIQPVMMRSPSRRRARAEITRAVGDLLRPVLGPFAEGLASPLFLPNERKLDAAVRDGLGPPAELCRPLTAAVQALAARADVAARPPAPTYDQPVPVAPGSLGSWHSSQEAMG